ncbi:hypothetical protein HOD19_01585 [bacterium]|jgi:hypothetical protein|nr:hypothetical protein [bacterium]
MKKTFIITLLITFGLFITQVAYAGSNKPICFKPMIAIPGFSNEGCDAGQIAISSKGDAIALYINALYDYAAGAAGVVAMFMIVFAAWQWMMAAGNASKIDTAKDTIRGALLGLAFLFTGHLLLSNISGGLVDFKSLSLTGIDTKNWASAFCQNIDQSVYDYGYDPSAHEMCGDTYATTTDDGQKIQCVDTDCPSPGGEQWHCVVYDGFASSDLCPSAVNTNESVSCRCIRPIPCDQITVDSCDEYDHWNDLMACDANKCYGEVMADGDTFTEFCGVENNNCNELNDIDCDSNEFCEQYNFDGHEFCCNTQLINQCAPISDGHCMGS